MKKLILWLDKNVINSDALVELVLVILLSPLWIPLYIYEKIGETWKKLVAWAKT